jgi:hypothetical protein
MGLMTMLGNARGGHFFAEVARSVDLDEAETRKAMAALCPAIALQLKAKASEDAELFDTLIDLIEDGAEGSPLEDPDVMTGPEALSDGNAILGDIYGSRNAAIVALREASDQVPERELVKLAPISATAVVAALAQANQPAAVKPMTLAGAQPAAETASEGGGGGIIGGIIGAVIAGAVTGAVRELTSTRRRRSTTSYSRTRSRKKSTRTKKKSTRRRTASASIEDIFRDILGGIRS